MPLLINNPIACVELLVYLCDMTDRLRADVAGLGDEVFDVLAQIVGVAVVGLVLGVLEVAVEVLWFGGHGY